MPKSRECFKSQCANTDVNLKGFTYNLLNTLNYTISSIISNCALKICYETYLIPTCWMAAKLGNARTFGCFTPSAQSHIQFLNVHKILKALKCQIGTFKTFKTLKVIVQHFFFFLNDSGSRTKIPASQYN